MADPTPPLPFPGGFLIAIEGIDGSGKTTQARRVLDDLRAFGLDVLLTKEPTDGPHGQRIRASKTAGRLSIEEELEAFIEDRREHVAGVIGPALDAGRVVIVDRYYFSTIAYQGARGVDPDEVARRNESFAPPPDLLLLLRVDPETGLERIEGRGDQADTFERVDLLARSARIFDSIARPYAVSIDACRPLDEVTPCVAAIVRRSLEGRLRDLASGAESRRAAEARAILDRL